MPFDPIIRPADSAPSYRELREQFREENRQRIHGLLQKTRHVVASSFGLEMLVRVRLRVKDLHPQWLIEERIKEFMQSGETYKIVEGREIKGRYAPIPEEGGELTRALTAVPESIQRKLDRNADNCRLFTSASLPEGEGVDHDGPPIDDLDDEQQIFDAIDKLKDQSNGQ